ncbi:hypothetical protein J7643_06080 [bacterium]|nr:hypothetical protein [bacterium]
MQETTAPGLSRLVDLNKAYEYQLLNIIACGRGLLACDAWHYEPHHLEAVLEIGDRIKDAASRMLALNAQIKGIEQQVGLG